MTGARPPTPAQWRSADPGRSVWVTANAGTGKTRVLADRVLRLLLEGAEPEGILCLTFTKAAAAEMTVRIEERLAAWATVSDERALAAELEALTGAVPDARRLATARCLLARVLELPRGLAIMTIHALCGSLLRRFPVEAGVPPHFETIDDRTAQELIAEAQQRVLRRAANRATPLGRAAETLAVTMADGSLTEALAEALIQRVALASARAAFGGRTEALIEAIYRRLEVDPAWEPPDILRRACADGIFDAAGLAELAAAFAGGGKRQQGACDGLLVFRNAVEAERHLIYERHEATFLTSEKKPRADICTDKFRREHPDLARSYDAEQARIGEVCERLKALTVARRTEALLRVALAAVDEYEALKAHKAVLDYDDLIERTSALLRRPGKAEWVLYKLDARIDHVLVDEAQDTSPRQWAIVEKLTEEFFAGEGARDAARTLFVVGDEKQSIYSFQGADLASFRAVRERLSGRAAAAGRPIRPELLDRSFRSVPAVLAVVDAVFALPEARGGVVDRDLDLRHDTERAAEPGLVELWPLARPAEAVPITEPWPLPGAPRAGDEPERRVARAIARTIRDWLDKGAILESTGRPIRPGDVMVLLARRGILQERLVRALRQAGVPAAGADRLALRDHIAVQDLMALGRAVLLPEDDLNLACLLKSPLVGLDEDDLFRLAWDRGEASLYDRLRDAAAAGPERLVTALARLSSWLERADFMPPFEFYTWILGPDGGRRRLLARLGPEAAEPIEAFLAQTLAYEQGHPTTLEGFLHWLGLGSDELKRDPDQARDVVRVVTVHGAKGLEAPIVFLADAGPRGAARRGRIHWTDPDAGSGVALPLWRASAAERDGLSEQIARRDAAAELEERRRLLYVALTRARDRLYVTGWLTKGDDGAGNGEPCWHELVRRAVAGLPDSRPLVLEPARGLPGDGLRLVRGAAQPVAAAEPAAVARTRPPPDWLRRPAPVETGPRRALAPSRAADPGVAPVAGANDQLRFQRGLLLHRLLQLLPDLPPAERPAAADRLLAALAREVPDELRAELAAAAVALLERPELSAVLGPGSRAEQPICGTLGGRPILGQIDRLVVTPHEVLVVDLKSDRRPPIAVGGAPASYLAQLAAYRELLARLHPGRRVRAALLWTEVPRLDEVPDALLDRHARDPA